MSEPLTTTWMINLINLITLIVKLFSWMLSIKIQMELCHVRSSLACFSLRLQQRFSCKALLSFLKSSAFFFADSIFISFNRSTLKAGHVVSTFSLVGRSIHKAVFQPPVPSPSYFPTSHDPPCAAETRGKVAVLRASTPGEAGNVVLTNLVCRHACCVVVTMKPPKTHHLFFFFFLVGICTFFPFQSRCKTLSNVNQSCQRPPVFRNLTTNATNIRLIQPFIRR